MVKDKAEIYTQTISVPVPTCFASFVPGYFIAVAAFEN